MVTDIKISKELEKQFLDPVKCYICLNKELHEPNGLKISFDTFDELGEHLGTKHTIGELTGRVLAFERMIYYGVLKYKSQV